MTRDHTRSRAGLALIWSAAIACPCHWPLLLIALAGGTAIGATLRANFVLVFAASAAYFAIAVGLGLWLVRRPHNSRASCTACISSPATAKGRDVGGA